MLFRSMSLLSSFFKLGKDLSKGVKNMEEGEEEGPCTSYSHKEKDLKHEGHLEFDVLSEYLAEY